MAETKEKLLRVLQIMHRTDEKTPINAQKICSILSDEFNLEGVDRKSIYRDMALLEDVGFNIRQCEDRRSGWYMESHTFEDWELKLLMDSCIQASCISEGDTSTLLAKLSSMASDRGKERFKKMIVPVSHNKLAKEVKPSPGNQIELLLEAVYTGKKVRFQYAAYDSNLKRVLRHDGRWYELSVYSLYYNKNTYYIIGCDNYHDGLSNYRLDRIENLSIIDKDAVLIKEVLGQNAEFQMQAYIETRVDNFGGDKISLTLECEPNDTSMLILKDFAGNEGDVSVGSRPIITHMANGNIRVQMMKQDSPTLINWILQYSNYFWVVAPEDLRQRVRDRLDEALKKYD